LDISPQHLENIQNALDDLRQGKMIILVDDEDRENEGDLCFAADRVSTEAINFMATHGRGLICVTLTPAQIARLELPMMRLPGRSEPALGTAFTVSVEAKHGVTTGISAADRATTIRAVANPHARPEDLVVPGHVFPLQAKEGGVLVRAGQTEGSVDLARLAGMSPAAVICEIINDDGSMARMPDLERFARTHQLRIVTIADLISYRLQTEILVRRLAQAEVRLDQTRTFWQVIVFEAPLQERQILALVKGDPTLHSPALCRMHAGSTLADTFSSTYSEGGRNLDEAILRIEHEGAGVIVYLPPRGDLVGELKQVSRRDSTPPESVTHARVHGGTLREYGLGAQVLRELGLHQIRLLTSNPRKIAGINGYGLEVVESVALSGTVDAAPE
jgi:3,4-dihydroxy 2-butanone 4-phosphate synthase/GTP cyclohydrolase II